MGHNCVPRFTKAQFGHGLVVCSLAHGDAIGNELMDMINAPQALVYHVTAELWLRLATCRGIQWDFACQRGRSRCPLSAKQAIPPIEDSIVRLMTCGFGSSGHFSTLLLIKPCQRSKSMFPLSNKYHLKLSQTLRSLRKEASKCN